MSEENVAVVSAIYEAWDQRASTDHLVAPDLEYVNPPYAVEGGTVRDRSALGRVLDVYPDFRLEESSTSTRATTWS